MYEKGKTWRIKKGLNFSAFDLLIFLPKNFGIGLGIIETRIPIKILRSKRADPEIIKAKVKKDRPFLRTDYSC